jgi:Flp pilus assembly protein TadG
VIWMTGAIVQSSSSRKEEGSFTVELVVLTPLLILFALMAIALGRYELAREQVIGAARAAAEAASVMPSGYQAALAADSAAVSGVRGSVGACHGLQVATDTSAFAPDGRVKVTITCRVDFSDLLVPGLPGSRVVKAVETAPIDPYQSVP